MPAQQKRKIVRGFQQIVAQNAATVLFYRNMSLTCGAFYNTFFFFFFYDQMSPLVMSMNILTTFIYITCYHLMRYISRPEYSLMTYQLIDPGHDLNQSGGIGEHLKDIVIITSVTHLMALFSDKFWLTLLLIPVKCFWVFWVTILGPWFTLDEIEEIRRQKTEKDRNQ
ncbi:PREDICTED: transmembrane protein 208-like [Papilio xuthus]|uniref:Transmembrane protein 208 n=1 Tax=Papilio xuthus TaxID=66420 RepID=A0AAJ7EIY0_PAPXU|nr:PREDICTED: transmembrane protein 208-like [Papilio xuthus]